MEKSTWKSYTEEQLAELNKINNKYKACLDLGKTERECTKLIEKILNEHGYQSLSKVKKLKKTIRAGDKIYEVYKGKFIVSFCIGQLPLEYGMNILGTHIDAPRIDVKQNPLYEKDGIAYLDTHYYGGIKKYQWVTLPLALHGVIVKKDGTIIDINIGEKLDLLLANRPISENHNLNNEEKEAVKANVLRILGDIYNVSEDDFASAELEIVPAGKARDCGIDRSMIMAYGQDDRACVFSSLLAMLEIGDIKRTACCIFVDKEEVGSVGATSMQSRFFENTVAELMALADNESEIKVRRALQNSKMLSLDVSAAYDPMYEEVFEKRSDAFLGKGLVFNKFTGSRGKSGANDANAEYLAQIRNIFDMHDITYQFTEFGKVDVGGGGTIAYIMANYGMDVVDSGVAVLSMHAPWEVTSKTDIYEAYQGYKVFLQFA